jgi:hypothetical protein
VGHRWILVVGLSLVIGVAARADDGAWASWQEAPLRVESQPSWNEPQEDTHALDGEAFDVLNADEFELEGSGDAAPTGEAVKSEDTRRRRVVNECVRLPKQIAKLHGDVEFAREQDNEVYEQIYKDQIARMETRYTARCGDPEGPNVALALLLETLRLLGKAAWLAFTWGLI